MHCLKSERNTKDQMHILIKNDCKKYNLWQGVLNTVLITLELLDV